MPFYQRTVEPRRVSRISARGSRRTGGENGKRRVRKAVLFSELDEVSCHTLTSVIHQLSDLSRHASDIFLGIEVEAGLVFQRSCRIQGRLRSLQGELSKLDHKNVTIRKFWLNLATHPMDRVVWWLLASVLLKFAAFGTSVSPQ